MRQLILLFVFLFAGFLGSWTYKIKTPVNRPNEYEEGYDPDAGAWWNTGKVEVDDDYKLDPTIPLNYIPVPGEVELYMVIDNNGNIIGYRKRTKQIDGSWKWEDVNPDIPDNYEPVDGLENVYKVTYDDGTVKYYKYIRNSDDTFAFVEVDEKGNPVGKNRDATKIDGKHVHISGNVYQLLDDNGVVIGYDKRISNGDGTFSWMDTEMPQLESLQNLQENFALPESGTGSNLQAPSIDTSAVDQAAAAMAAANAAAAAGGDASYNVNINVNGGNLGQGGYQLQDPTDGPLQVINHSDGTHTETKIVRETKRVDGWTHVYETYVKNTYDDAGNLIATDSDGPYEVDQPSQNIATPSGPLAGGSTTIEETLSNEVARVSGSYSYNTAVANEIASKLNAQRAANGISTLQISDAAMQLAKLRAADMAANDAQSSPLPTYGTLSSMIANFGVASTASGENLWKTIEMTADDIHTRFQAVDQSRNVRMKGESTQYGVAVVVSNGYYYVCEILL